MAVLTGPLWITAVLVLIAIAVAGLVASSVKRRPIKILVGVGIFLAVLFLPYADEIAGRIYLSRLCDTEAGVRVYHSVELPREYWDEEGKPNFTRAYGLVDMSLLPNRFEWRKVTEQYVNSTFLRIEKWRWELVDKATNKVLGENIDFMRHFGWINQFSTAPNVGHSCDQVWGKPSREEVVRRTREKEQKLFGGTLKPPK